VEPLQTEHPVQFLMQHREILVVAAAVKRAAVEDLVQLVLLVQEDREYLYLHQVQQLRILPAEVYLGRQTAPLKLVRVLEQIMPVITGVPVAQVL
jgi:hypothetical protein